DTSFTPTPKLTPNIPSTDSKVAISIPIHSIYIDLPIPSKNSSSIPEEKSEPEAPISKSQEQSHFQPNDYELTPPHLAIPFQTFPVSLGEHTFYATHAPEPNPSLHYWLEMSLQGQALSFSAIEEGSLGNEAGDANIQQPLVVVNCTPASNELPIPTNSLLPLSHLGDATFQSPQPIHKPRAYDVPSLLVSPPHTGECNDPMEQCRDRPDVLNSGAQRSQEESSPSGSQHLIINLPGNTASQNFPSPTSSIRTRRENRCEGNRRGNNHDEGNSIRNIRVKVYKNSNIQREIRKKTHTHLSIKSVQKLNRYMSFVQPRNWELCSDNEPDSNNREREREREVT
ncbi:hypothetical protein H5410_048827, partial [Solanum commersonii]